MKIPNQNLSREYLRWSILYHMSAAGKIKVISDYGIRIGGDAFLIPSILPSWLVFDLDKTLTADGSVSVYEEYNENVCSVLGIPSFRLRKLIKEIDLSPNDFSIPKKRYENELRRLHFKKRHHDDACTLTEESENIKFIPHAFDAIVEQEKLNCLVGINTGSPKDVTKEVVKKKIGIQEPNIAGSKPIFDSHENFLEFYLNLGTNKPISMSNFHLPECYCDFSLTVNPNEARQYYVTDDLSDFEWPLAVKIGSKLGIVLYVGEDYSKIPRIGEFVINAPEIRKDPRRIGYYLNLHRRSKIFPYIHDPKTVRKIIDTAEEILYLAETYEGDYSLLLEKIPQFLSLEVLFPSLTTNVSREYQRLKHEDINLPHVKEGIKNLVNILKENDPAFHATSERKNELDNIILSASPQFL
jgi:hypothetical protein